MFVCRRGGFFRELEVLSKAFFCRSSCRLLYFSPTCTSSFKVLESRSNLVKNVVRMSKNLDPDEASTSSAICIRDYGRDRQDKCLSLMCGKRFILMQIGWILASR